MINGIITAIITPFLNQKIDFNSFETILKSQIDANITGIVLFGSTGMLGRYVYLNLKNGYNVICIKREQFDIENDEWSKLQYLLCDNLKENDIIINCAGIIPQKIKNDNFKTYIRVNTLFPHKLN